MGLLSRLLSPSRSGSGAPSTALTGLDLSSDHRLPVVGESFYQEELARVAGPKQPGGIELEVRAVLVPEPDNPYDAKAIAIYLDGAGKVGHLSRDDAVAYGPLTAQCARRNRVATCEAVVLGADSDRATMYCVWLHIEPPEHRLADGGD